MAPVKASSGLLPRERYERKNSQGSLSTSSLAGSKLDARLRRRSLRSLLFDSPAGEW